jgi:hypothetical protein
VLTVKPTGLLFVAAAALHAGCSSDGRPEKFYVVVQPTGAAQYYLDMTSLVERRGLNPNPGTANDPWGSTLYVVEGKGRGVRVWSRNVLLSERQAVACGGPQQTRNDPTQFVVTVSNRRVFGEDEVSAVTAELKAGLEEQGYDVRAEPRTCATPQAGQ